ncbi:hypothetical protein O9X98_05560 [Agrobacterium salinitolerans]|nr:hypothetical protein [Agrobacterium salinitolerans]
MSELSRFKERHGASCVAIAFAALVGAAGGVVISTGVAVNGGVPQMFDRLVSGHSENGLALLDGADGPKFDAGHASALAETEKNAVDKKAALTDAADALKRVATASDMSSGTYPSGEAGLKARERDFVEASNDYAKATAKLDTRSEADILADRNAGPGRMDWKADELTFSADALEAVGATAGPLKR